MRRPAQRRRHIFPFAFFIALIVIGVAIVVVFTDPSFKAAEIVENAVSDVTNTDADDTSDVQTAAGDGSYPISGTVSLAVDKSRFLYSNPYDWSNLTTDANGNFIYVGTASDGSDVTLSREGIDVSEHNGTIDWAKVRADGIDYAIIRIGAHGTANDAIVVDDSFSRNLAGAKEAGLGVGAYFYSQATTEDEAVTEAKFVLEQLNGAQLSYPVIFDFEPVAGDRAFGLTTQERTSIAAAFCSTIEDAGYKAAIYCSSSDLTNMYNLDRLSQYGFWMAQYSATPTTSVAFTMWQYTNTGTVNGIQGSVDLNIDLTPALQAAEGELDL